MVEAQLTGTQVPGVTNVAKSTGETDTQPIAVIPAFFTVELIAPDVVGWGCSSNGGEGNSDKGGELHMGQHDLTKRALCLASIKSIRHVT